MSQAQPAEGQEKKKSSMLGTAVMLGIAVLVPVCLALGVYVMVLKPILAPAGGETGGEGEKKAAAEKPAEDFPAEAKVLSFSDLKANVLTEEGGPPALVLFSVVLICNEEVFMMFEEGKEYLDLFTAEITERMRGRTRAELENAQVLESILKQIQQRANQLAHQLKPDAEVEIYKAKFKELVIAET